MRLLGSSLSDFLIPRAKREMLCGDELIQDSSSLYKLIHDALNIKMLRPRDVEKYDTRAEQKLIAANSKMAYMRGALENFSRAQEEGNIFTEGQEERLTNLVQNEKNLESRIQVFSKIIHDKLAQYFDNEAEGENFFGGIVNQLATTMSLTMVSARLLKDKAMNGSLVYLRGLNYQKDLMKIVRNMKKMLYGLSKTHFSAVRKLFNVLGSGGRTTANNFQYNFNEEYFGLDDEDRPTKLLAKKSLIRDLWKSSFNPFYRDGLRPRLSLMRVIPAFGCPALAIKAPNGDNFIKVIHNFICDNFEKMVLPGLNQFMKVDPEPRLYNVAHGNKVRRTKRFNLAGSRL